ncbi:hypothetical protein BO94DRAFT_571240 [Aspergillus sclerotioniger CBS 115572]|uniref:Uncharacterized protein n=1 Tax=Aspergillus sclerotioniger CBS 115572 TaxID=1450535 RepID=A0A317XB22_9EURO|nr:hypothetical protein BO94DRAFT_571240 [Aspergillus sclerotioniger CBS 115572]PWY95689.1 hypothetical protein BO94DRAFT_571240 [Aspergillus sclerotioniger CBS 115572]
MQPYPLITCGMGVNYTRLGYPGIRQHDKNSVSGPSGEDAVDGDVLQYLLWGTTTKYDLEGLQKKTGQLSAGVQLAVPDRGEDLPLSSRPVHTPEASRGFEALCQRQRQAETVQGNPSHESCPWQGYPGSTGGYFVLSDGVPPKASLPRLHGNHRGGVSRTSHPGWLIFPSSSSPP